MLNNDNNDCMINHKISDSSEVAQMKYQTMDEFVGKGI